MEKKSYRKTGNDEFYIGGVCVARIHDEVRAPLHMLTTTREGSAPEWPVAVMAHRTSYGDHWFTRKFHSKESAIAYFEKLKAKYPASKTAGQWIAANSGRNK